MHRHVPAAAGVLASFALVAPLWAQQDENAKKLLTESRDAIKTLPGLTFKSKRSLEGAPQLAMKGDAQVKFVRNQGNAVASSFWAQGEMIMPMSDKPTKIDTMYNGTIVSYLDHTAKLVVEKKQADSAQHRNVKTHRDQFVPQSFFDRNPFERELLSPNISMGDIIEVGGEKCQVVVISMPASERESRIAISLLDKLPRRSEQVAKVSGGNASFVLEVTDLKIVSDLDPSKWQVAAPEGYQRRAIEDAQPATVPAPQPAPQPSPAPAAPPVPAVQRGGLEPGATAPTFALDQIGGGRFDLAQHKGKVVVVGFWGATFGASKNALAVLDEVHKAKGDKPIEVVGIAARTEAETATKFFAETKASFPGLLAGDDVAKQFRVRGYPSVAVITGEGRVSAFFQSAPSKEDLDKAIDAAIQGK